MLALTRSAESRLLKKKRSKIVPFNAVKPVMMVLVMIKT